MQKKKNIFLLMSLVVLVAVTLVVYRLGREETSFADERIFKVDDLSVVDSVMLMSPDDTVSLHYDGARWRVNSAYADGQLVDVLFATLQGIKPRRPVAEMVRDTVEEELRERGVTVSLFAGTELVKIFLAGGNERKTEAYFMDPETGVPYLVTIPGYRVYASGIFELDESGWRDKYVFSFNWRNFQQLEATFPGAASKNFTVAMSEGHVEIEGVNEPDTARLNEFLDKVSLLTVNKYLSGDELLRDSLLRQQPDMHIRVKDIAAREFALAIYSRENPSGDVLTLVNGSQPALIGSGKIGGIFHPKSYFLKK